MMGPGHRATMCVLADLVTPAFLTDRNLSDIMLLTAVRLTLQHGICGESCYPLACVFGVLASNHTDAELGFRLSQFGVSLADQQPQYATLKAIGYRSGYLLRVVLEQASFNALAGWIPAWLLSIGLYYVIGRVALLPLQMSVNVTLVSLGLTLGMCLISAVLAVKRVIQADPAEVF